MSVSSGNGFEDLRVSNLQAHPSLYGLLFHEGVEAHGTVVVVSQNHCDTCLPPSPRAP